MKAAGLRDLAPENVRSIAPYVPGKPVSETARELGLDAAGILKMASNENPLGASPKAIEAIRGALADLASYPDGSGYDLKRAIGRAAGVAPECLVLGNGSNDALELVARTFLTPADSAVFSRYAFLVYPLAVRAVGAKAIEVPARGFAMDLPAMAAAVRADTKAIFLANPNNPTGLFTPWAEVRDLVAKVGPRRLVVIDEAYGEYLPEDLRSPTVGWLEACPNLVITRTLSKAYGLAGLRIGYAIAHPDVAELMNRVRQPFNVNHLAMVAACAALEDRDFLEASCAMNAAGLAQLAEGFGRLHLDFLPSRANFIAVNVGDGTRVAGRLLQAGVIVRPIASYGMPGHIRVTAGTSAQNARFLAALEAALGTG